MLHHSAKHPEDFPSLNERRPRELSEICISKA
jgi:hypothetical protein